MSNPFATEKAWDLSSAGGDLLPVGDHKCTILSAEDDTSSGGYPQVVLEVGNEQGQTRKDWLTITQNSVGRIVGLVELLPGVERPSDNDVGPDLRLSQKYLNTWAGQPIGDRRLRVGVGDRLGPAAAGGRGPVAVDAW
jgi:hypothetical protein